MIFDDRGYTVPVKILTTTIFLRNEYVSSYDGTYDFKLFSTCERAAHLLFFVILLLCDISL